MTKQNKGLAAIPLILLFAVMIIAIPLAMKKSQEVTTVQNRAAAFGQLGEDCSTKPCDPSLICARKGTQYICQRPNGSPQPSIVPCTEILNMKQQFCPINAPPRPYTIPCNEIDLMIQNNNCGTQQPSPTRLPPTPMPTTVYPTKSPSPTIVPTRVPSTPTASPCTPGQTKTVGTLRFICNMGTWQYTKIGAPVDTQ